jgi:4'-phosphopantetheinyl transferase
MSAGEGGSADWRFDGVRVWLRPHRHGERGEPQARQLLGAALAVDPAALPLARDARGWPWLQPPLQRFGTGWSHSGNQLLVGLGEGLRLGVDLERVRPRPRMLEVAERFFHADEAAWLQALAPAQREPWFFRLWCAKEALLKAHGHGIAFGLHRLRFEDAGGALRLAWCDPALGEAGRWRLHEWQATAEHRAALAAYPLDRRGSGLGIRD